MWCWTILEDPESSWARLSNSLSSNHGHGDHGASTFCVPFSSLGERCHLVVLVMHPLIWVIFSDVSWYWMNDLDMCFASWKLRGDGPLDSDDPDLVECSIPGRWGQNRHPGRNGQGACRCRLLWLTSSPKISQKIQMEFGWDFWWGAVHDMYWPWSFNSDCEEPYMHIGYEYQLHRATMPRSGEGDLWLNYEGQPKISLQGVAQSPKFGKGILALKSHQNYSQNRWSFTWPQPVATGLLSVSLSTIRMFLFLHVPGNPQIYQIWIFLHK